MAKKKLVLVDRAKLYAELKKRGVTPSQAADEFGYAKNYIHNAASVGKLNETCAVLLERVYGIKREDYKPCDKVVEPVEPVSESKINQLDYDKLYQTIYTATYCAYRHAFVDRSRYIDKIQTYLRDKVWQRARRKTEKMEDGEDVGM